MSILYDIDIHKSIAGFLQLATDNLACSDAVHNLQGQFRNGKKNKHIVVIYWDFKGDFAVARQRKRRIKLLQYR